MRYIKKFNESTNEKPFITDPPLVRQYLNWLTNTSGSLLNDDILGRYKINEGGEVSVTGDILVEINPSRWKTRVENPQIRRLPIKFKSVTGKFIISNCPYLTTLEGCPDSCENFIAKSLPITNLIGGPSIVMDSYKALWCGLKTLEGAPEFIPNDFDVEHNPLTSLKGAPRTVGGYFDCSYSNIKNLIGGPEEVGTYQLSCTSLTSLEGAPKRADLINFYPYNELRQIGGSEGNSIYDPTPLKDCNIGLLQLHREPIAYLIKCFSPNGVIDELVTSRFLESLDYNYVRGASDGKFNLNFFRFKEALAEFDLSGAGWFSGANQFYRLINDEGAQVNISGNPI